MEKIVYSEIIKLFESGVNPSDIFVLGPSVKGDKSNISIKLMNISNALLNFKANKLSIITLKFFETD